MKKLLLLTAMIVLSSLLAFTAQAQERIVLEADTTYILLENQFELGSRHLTANQKTEMQQAFTEKIQERFPDVKDTKQLSFRIMGMTDPNNWPEACKNERWGDNDNYPYAITSKATLEQCANVNEIGLGWDRAQSGVDFVITNGWVDPFRVDPVVYGAVDETSDGKPTRRTLMIAVIKHNSAELAEMPEIKSINRRAERQDTDINNVIVGLNANTDQTNQNTDRIDDLDQRVSTLEKDRLISGHIGLSGQYFASQLVPSAEIGLGVGQFEFTGFIGYHPWLTADLEEGPTDYTRSQIGWSATWYALSHENFRVGPMIGYEWARDDFDAINCEIIYQSPLAGIATDVALTKHLSLYANVAYAPTSVQITGNLEKDGSDVQIRAGLRINF